VKLAWLLLAAEAACVCAAHPMGNFSVSHYTRLEVSAQRVTVSYVLDLAEVPAYELLRDWKLTAQSPQADLDRKAVAQAREWAKGIEFRGAGRPVEPKLVSASAQVRGGSGGLSTVRVSCTFELEGAASPLTFEDHNYSDRAGWKEIVIRNGGGVRLVQASQGATDRSEALAKYPSNAAKTAPQDLRASVEWRPAVASLNASPRIVAIAQPPPVPTPAAEAPLPAQAPATARAPVAAGRDHLSKLLGRKDLPLGWLLAGIAVAFGLGAAHALEPGHGKTIVAAYLVGARGTMKHAAFLGGMVTFTHTFSVFLLGLGTMLLSRYIVPQKILPVLGAISGVSIVAIGASMFYKRLRTLRAAPAHQHHHSHAPDPHTHAHNHAHDHAQGQVHSHSHDPGEPGDHAHGHAQPHSHDNEHAHVHSHPHSHAHDHDHPHTDDHSHTHGHGPGGHTHVIEGEITLGSLMALGASGGLVPCPAAMVLLLSSIALGHTGAGLILLIAFSLGLAGVLMAIGMMVLYAKSWLPEPAQNGRHPLFRLVPVLSAAVIVCLGLLMTGVSLGWVRSGLAG
jgi:nickel/cobalt transporter (NicO) family protein